MAAFEDLVEDYRNDREGKGDAVGALATWLATCAACPEVDCPTCPITRSAN